MVSAPLKGVFLVSICTGSQIKACRFTEGNVIEHLIPIERRAG